MPRRHLTLAELKQRLIDADYFSIAQVQPDTSQAHDGIVPIKVMLAPAKRNIYTAGVFLDTDIGFGVRGGLTRRWLNDKGHKLKVDVFVVYTDNETWFGGIHPAQALEQYRQSSGIDAKLIVVGGTASEFTIADPNDAGMLER